MLDSMKKYASPFQLFVLCLDDYTFRYLKEKEKNTVIPFLLKELEDADAELTESQYNRSRIEYFFTLSPCLPLYILNKFPHIDKITYLDSDLYFFSGVKPLFDELGSKSIYTIPHRFPEQYKEMEGHGKFNVGFQIFRNDEVGRACLERWRHQCIAWCYDKLEDDKYADQKYLDDWPVLYKDSIVISQNPGANLAPWNVGGLKLRFENRKVYVNNKELIFYHFHRLRFINSRLLTHGLEAYYVRPGKILKNRIYAPYIGALRRKNIELNRLSDRTERLYKSYSFKELRKLFRRGYTFLYIKDQRCFRIKWNPFYP